MSDAEILEEISITTEILNTHLLAAQAAGMAVDVSCEFKSRPKDDPNKDKGLLQVLSLTITKPVIWKNERRF